MDVKFSITALLEAATSMMQEGLTPRRTVFLAFGHDEEVGDHKEQEGEGRHAFRCQAG